MPPTPVTTYRVRFQTTVELLVNARSPDEARFIIRDTLACAPESITVRVPSDEQINVEETDGRP